MEQNAYLLGITGQNVYIMEHPLTDTLIRPIDGEFIAIEEFMERMKDCIPTPYHAQFSFAKLIEELQDNQQALQINLLSSIVSRLEKLELLLQESDTDWKELLADQDNRSLLIFIFQSFFFKDQMGFIKGPFENLSFRYQTDSFQGLIADDTWEIKLNANNYMTNNLQNILLAGIFVLNTFYDQNLDFISNQGMTIRDRTTKIEKHYRFNINVDYLEVKAVKPLKKLSDKQIHELLNNLSDGDLWMKYIPPENFVFEGLIIGFISDVTKEEILSTLKVMAANEGGKSNHENDLNYLEILAKSFLNQPEVKLGILQTTYGPWIESLTWCLLRTHDEDMVQCALDTPTSAYAKVMKSNKPYVVDDLQMRKDLTDLERGIRDQGIRSLLLAPLKDIEGKIISIFELASPEPYQFNHLTLVQLEEFISLMEMGTNKFIQEMNNSINLTIQQEFTSIHPSVEWKFRHVASKYFWERVIQLKQSSPDQIVFKNVYPLYGQADIVGSSRHRNESIRSDLTDNLQRLHRLLVACRKELHFHLLDVYDEKVSAHLERLKKSFVSSDESIIVELLTVEIHPLLTELRERFPQLPQQMLDDYFDYMDTELGIVYRKRKAYEDSVALINQTISNFLLEEEEKMQQILPHYFEKFQTDGVEYNIYLGQSILEEGTFHPFYLRDFRLWQLIMMCKITRLVEKEVINFPLLLTTAQLVFVYNSSLSIRFQMDEKKFDVDGAYNVRYEILKKRIDKAYIKGTQERLTQPGKIAIVWLQEKDRQEYQEYLDHLIRNEYIHPDVEDLELEKMQGVEGLKAIRVTVMREE